MKKLTHDEVIWLMDEVMDIPHHSFISDKTLDNFKHLLELAYPKPAKRKNEDMGEFNACQTCDWPVFEVDGDWCANCGQRQDWAATPRLCETTQAHLTWLSGKCSV